MFVGKNPKTEKQGTEAKVSESVQEESETAVTEWNLKLKESDQALEKEYLDFTKARIQEETSELQKERPNLYKIAIQNKQHIRDRRNYFLTKRQAFEYELDIFMQQEENRVLKELAFTKILEEKEEELQAKTTDLESIQKLCLESIAEKQKEMEGAQTQMKAKEDKLEENMK